MRYRAVRPLPLLLDIVIGCLVLGCSNSEYTESTGWEEYANSAYVTEGDSPSGKQSCFDNFRLPNLQSATCQEQFYTQDTITDFPESGFFQKTFTITFPDNKLLNCEIGGKPATKESHLISAIQVDSSMTIRCADFSENAASAEIIRTYILEKNPDIAAIFLTTDPNSLFDPDTGIYMEGPNAEAKEPHYGANYWLDKEIPVFVELIEPYNNNPAFAKHAGLKIFGNWSRMKTKKSVAITFREKYGDKRLYYTLFPDYPNLKMFKGFILRNNGNNFGVDYIRDRLAGSLSEGLDVDFQQGRFALVYYNSKYYGIHDLRERSNEYYFETHYGMNHKGVNVVEASNYAAAGNPDDFNSLLERLKENDLNIDSNYNYISSKIDIDNYINYTLVEMFTNNRDWPGNNQKKWNCPNIQNKWKWFLYDLDITFITGNGVSTKNTFDYVTSENSDYWANAPKHTFLFRSLLNNNNFKETFINRIPVLIQTNFESSQILSKIDKMMDEIKTEIPRDQNRWQLDPTFMDEKLSSIKKFARNRPKIFINELQDYFKIGEITPLTLSVNGNGIIKINGWPIKSSSFTTNFFKGFPITISAEPQAGHTWVSWSDGNTNLTRTIYPEKTKKIIALFN